jgi:hypothetical protein
MAKPKTTKEQSLSESEALAQKPTGPPFIVAGTEKSKIQVRISYRIIELFSQGLYRSPTKAIEELVSNAYDAGATKVHVAIDADLVASDATIAVIDNGSGMDEAGLRQHWLIGVSNKRQGEAKTAKGRPQIGRFGIGKLATFVLAGRLTHIARCNGKYYATTMNYAEIPQGADGGIYAEDPVMLPLRELTEAEAKEALDHWLGKDKPGYKEITLFGKGAEKNWTIAILSDLKEMSRELKRGRLRWVLATAMPIRDDFRLFLDGDPVTASKLQGKRYGRWTVGKGLKELPEPAPDELEVTEDLQADAKSQQRFGLTHPQLGRVTGYVDLYEDVLTGGKSSEAGRSHGFFVYVRDRLINLDDEYFGIDSNLLRHGTFARFRMVVQVDRLDDELRSSRETVREGTLLEVTRNILRGAFNFARNEHAAIEQAQTPGAQAAQRIAATPASLARRPLVSLVTKALEGKYTPLFTKYPRNLSPADSKSFIAQLTERAESPEGLVRSVELLELSTDETGIATFDAESGTLNINALHPYIAHFLDEYEHKTRVPLELLAMSEVLLEAHLFERGLDQKTVKDVLLERDELLRVLSRSAGKRNARLIAQGLLDASTNAAALEIELVAAFDSMGFHDPIRIGGKGKPDGLAEARLGATEGGQQQYYRVTLEAKSKETPGTKVTAKSVGISTIARQRDDYGAKYAVVVGPDFPPSAGDKSALAKEIQADRKHNKKDGKGITLIRIEDMARLVRLVPAKRIGLDRLNELFATCSLPEESKAWVDAIANEKMVKPPYRELLEAIAAEQQEMPNQAIEYGNVLTRLRVVKKMTLEKAEVVDLCKALSKMAPGYVFARTATVELTQRPDKILDAIAATIREYPEEEQKKIAFPK